MIGAVSTTTHRRQAIATVTTRSNGTFTGVWRPRRPGDYTITALLRHAPRGVLRDRSCDLAMTATRRRR